MQVNSGLLLGVAIAALILLAIVSIYLVWQQEKQRRAKIEAKRGEWGDDLANTILEKNIRPGMTVEMVLLSWGQPSNIDKKEITKRGLNKERWVYGQPRRGANYVYFSDGEVQKIQT